MERAMAAATDDERLAVRHLPVRRQERKQEKGRKKTNAILFFYPLSAFAEHPLFENIAYPMHGLVYKEDYEKGLAEAWEQAKPKGSTVTVEEKLKQLSTQNNPHFIDNRPSTAA